MKKLRLLRAAAWALLLLAAVLFLAYCFREPLLIQAGRWWIVDEPVVSAEAVVVLGGGAQSRPFAAAELVRDRVTTNVLLARVQATPTDQTGITTHESDLSHAFLLKKGVPENQIVLIGTNVASTYDEARAIRA